MRVVQGVFGEKLRRSAGHRYQVRARRFSAPGSPRTTVLEPIRRRIYGRGKAGRQLISREVVKSVIYASDDMHRPGAKAREVGHVAKRGTRVAPHPQTLKRRIGGASKSVGRTHAVSE